MQSNAIVVNTSQPPNKHTKTNETMDVSEPPINESQDYALRFEDLTVDDDLPLLDRIVKYCRSGIALQRLVHVKMLAETAETVGYVLEKHLLSVLFACCFFLCCVFREISPTFCPYNQMFPVSNIPFIFHLQDESNDIDTCSCTKHVSDRPGVCHTATLSISIITIVNCFYGPESWYGRWVHSQ